MGEICFAGCDIRNGDIASRYDVRNGEAESFLTSQLAKTAKQTSPIRTEA